MSEKRRGLGKGLGALIPTAPSDGRPVDVFFPTQERAVHGDTQPQKDEPPGRSAAAAKEAPSRSTATRPAGTGSATATKQGSGTPRTRTASKRARIPADTLGPRQRTARSAAAAGTPVAPDDADGASRDAGPTEVTEATDDAHVPQDAPAAQDAPSTDNAQSGALVSVPGARFAEVQVDEVVANRRQPRQVFDEDDLDELAASIREVGVLQPIVVRELPETEEARYELIMGERRWRASQLAGNATVPAIIKEVDDTDLLRDALLENLHRAQLNPLEEAAAYQQLLDDFDCTHEELAARIVRSRPQISNTLRLLKLPPLVQRRVAAGVLSAGHARALLGLSDPAAMERLAQRIVAEGLSVRTTEEIVALGDEPIAPEMRRRPRTGAHTADLEQLATRLADRFDTRVKIGMGQRKGKINIEFASLEDLNRILEVLAPNVEGVPAQ